MILEGFAQQFQSVGGSSQQCIDFCLVVNVAHVGLVNRTCLPNEVLRFRGIPDLRIGKCDLSLHVGILRVGLQFLKANRNRLLIGGVCFVLLPCAAVCIREINHRLGVVRIEPCGLLKCFDRVCVL